MKDRLINPLVFTGALFCIAVPLLFVEGQSPLFPLPGLYFLELGAVGLLVMWMTSARRLPLAPWIGAGVIFAFVILGAWTIGFYLAPACLAFIAAGALWHGRLDRGLLTAFGALIAAALAQSALMLFLVAQR